MAEQEQPFSDISATLKKVSAALREADVPFLLGGSLASWARGGPESRHDLDFMVKPEDVERALGALAEAGLRPERPPEEWLVKAWDGDVLVDLIHGPQGMTIDDSVIERGDELTVCGVTVRVMAMEDLLSTKLLALTEHSLDLEPSLRIARSLREQVDWSEVRARTFESPYARAFLYLLDELGVTASQPREEASRARVRVVPDA